MDKKVLIGIPTFPGQENCLEAFCEHIKKIDYPFFDVLFVVDKGEDDYKKKIESKGFFCAMLENEKGIRIENITNCRKLLRKKMLEGNYEYLMFIDSDVLVPQEIIKKLMNADKPICSGIFLSTFSVQGKAMVAPVAYNFAGEEKIRLMMKNEVLSTDLKKIAVCGFGCCLIKREVLEKVDFRWYEQSKSGEDAAFCHDAAKLGYKTWLDCNVKTWHISYPPGDERNEKFKIGKH